MVGVGPCCVARFRHRVGLAPVLPIPLFDAHDNLTDEHDKLTNDDEEDVESDINNHSGGAVLPDDNPVNGSTVRTTDDATTTALGHGADGSVATIPASATALDPPVDGSDAPQVSTTALDLPVDGSDLPEEGDATDAGSDGNEVGTAGVNATDTSSTSPVQHPTLFPLFRRGNARIGQSPATTDTARNVRSISSVVGRGSELTARADHPPLLVMHPCPRTLIHTQACRLLLLVPQRVSQPNRGRLRWQVLLLQH